MPSSTTQHFIDAAASTAPHIPPPFLSKAAQDHQPDRQEMLLHLLKGVKHVVDFTGSETGEEKESFQLKHKLLQQYLTLWAQKEGQSARPMLAHIVRHHINKQACNGCGLYTVICRNDALVQLSPKGAPKPILENCSGCGLCISGCPKQAISNSSN